VLLQGNAWQLGSNDWTTSMALASRQPASRSNCYAKIIVAVTSFLSLAVG